MKTDEAKVYATTRFKELTKEFPGFDQQYKVNLIIKELRQKHDFDTLTFSTQHGGWIKVKSVELPSKTQPIMTYNTY